MFPALDDRSQEPAAGKHEGLPVEVRVIRRVGIVVEIEPVGFDVCVLQIRIDQSGQLRVRREDQFTRRIQKD